MLYDVHPRYTPGSPAGLVTRPALRVLRDEEEFHGHALTGVAGARQQRLAQVYGMHGIVTIRSDDGMAFDEGARYSYRDSPLLRLRDIRVVDLLLLGSLGTLSKADKRRGWHQDAVIAGRALLAAGVTATVDLDRCEDVAKRLREHGAFGPFTWLATALAWGKR